MFDLISIGDVVIDTFVPLVEAEIVEKKGIKLLAVPYGSKVPVEPSVSTVGGNAANNAVGAARLKLKTAIYANVGNKDDDEADDRIKAKLKREGVDIHYIAETKELPSDHHVILYFQGERTILTHHQDWKYQLPDLDRSKWVYFTSISPSFTESNLYDQVVNYLERSRAKLVFQPGTFQIQQGLKKNAKLLSMSELYLSNLEEAKKVLGHEVTSNIPIKKLLQELADLGTRNAVITNGREGSVGFDGRKFWQIGVFPAEVVEVTGAGDAFSTGTLAGLFYSESLPEAMRWGSANSASVIQQVGPQAGLLSLHALQEVLKNNLKLVANEVK